MPDEQALPGQSPLWLPEGVGAIEKRGMGSEQKTGLEALEGAGAEGPQGKTA